MHGPGDRAGGFRAIAVLLMVVSISFMSLMVVPDEAAAQEPTYSEASLDGYIDYQGLTYPPDTSWTLDTNDDWITVGQYRSTSAPFPYHQMRGFVSFNTSYIPDDAVIQSVVFKMMTRDDLSTYSDFSVHVYECEYDTLDVDDWNITGVFQGTLLDTGSMTTETWYSMNAKASSVNASGHTSYMLKSSRDGVTTSTREYITLYSGDYSSNAPILLVSYSLLGTSYAIQLTTGDWNNYTMFADIQDWNLTYDLWCFEFDTFPDADNVTITKANSSWAFQGVAPLATYAEDDGYLNLTDVYDSITYRVWFTVPKVNPYTTVHLSLYNTFTGEGLYWEAMRVRICEGSTFNESLNETVARPDFYVECERNYTLRVLDYFGNALVDYTFTANAQDVFVTVAVPYYSWQVFNMNELPVLMKIYWNNSGSPWEFFVGPQWIMERNLKGGDYTFMVTFYDATGLVGETVYYNRTVPSSGLNASFIYINGTTLTEIVTDIEGLQATQEIITSLVSPSMVYVYENLPLAPVSLKTMSLSDSLAIDPYLVLEATTFQNDSGTDLELWLPYPNLTGATYYIMSDVLTFSGTYATSYWVNDTDTSTNLYNGTALPATLLLDGENVTVETSSAVSVSRATTWREVTEYVVTYYPTQRKYTCTLNLNDSMAFDFYEPYWFIGFPQNTSIALDSVTVTDLDNDLILSQTAHFEVTAGGVHMTLSRLNSSENRSFSVTYFDYNSTDWIGAPNLVAYAYTTASYDGTPMKFTAVQWGNPWSIEYRGEVYITLNFTYGDCLKTSSIKIVEQNSGRVLTDSEWVYTGRTIIILTSGVGTVPVGGGVNFGIYWTFDATQADDKTDFFFGPIVWDGKYWYIGGFAVSWALIVIILGWIAVGFAVYGQKKDWQALAIIWGCVTIILFLIQRQVT